MTSASFSTTDGDVTVTIGLDFHYLGGGVCHAEITALSQTGWLNGYGGAGAGPRVMMYDTHYATGLVVGDFFLVTECSLQTLHVLFEAYAGSGSPPLMNVFPASPVYVEGYTVPEKNTAFTDEGIDYDDPAKCDRMDYAIKSGLARDWAGAEGGEVYLVSDLNWKVTERRFLIEDLTVGRDYYWTGYWNAINAFDYGDGHGTDAWTLTSKYYSFTATATTQWTPWFSLNSGELSLLYPGARSYFDHYTLEDVT